VLPIFELRLAPLAFKFFNVIFFVLFATAPLPIAGEIVYAGTLEFLGLLIRFF
jgi:hypothetical protein